MTARGNTLSRAVKAAAVNSRGEPQHGARLVLVPDGPRRSRREQYRVAVAGNDGQTVFRGIPSGSYELFAWEDSVENAHLNDDYLRRTYEERGVPVNAGSR